MWDFLYDYVVPTVVSIAALSITTILPPLAFAWFKKRGIEIDEARQRMFQTGLDQAAGLVVARAGGKPITTVELQQGVDYLRESVPGTIAEFEKKQGHFSDSTLQDKVAAKIGSKASPIIEAVVDTAIETAIPGKLGELASDFVISAARRVRGVAPIPRQ